ncbi:MAG: hypothetical protein PHS02_01305 [Candidatus ainarchaeum sp.]|nr:hypothetical protein [Candidatus ainarchaeum sp.]
MPPNTYRKKWVAIHAAEIKRTLPTRLAEEILDAPNPRNAYAHCMSARARGVCEEDLAETDKWLESQKNAQKLVYITVEARQSCIGRPYSEVKDRLKGVIAGADYWLQVPKLEEMLLNQCGIVSREAPRSEMMPAIRVLAACRDWAKAERNRRIAEIRAGEEQCKIEPLASRRWTPIPPWKGNLGGGNPILGGGNPI